MSAFADHFQFRCQQKQLMLLSYRICPSSCLKNLFLCLLSKYADMFSDFVNKVSCIFIYRVMQIMIDSTEVDRGPIMDNRLHMSLYYVCFVVVFSFFFLNIFVALIIVTFQERGERELIGCELTKNQVIMDLVNWGGDY